MYRTCLTPYAPRARHSRDQRRFARMPINSPIIADMPIASHGCAFSVQVLIGRCCGRLDFIDDHSFQSRDV